MLLFPVSSCEMLKLTLSVISCIFNLLLPGPLCAAGFAGRSWSTDCKSLSEHWTLVWPPDCCRYASNVTSPEHVESSSSLIMRSTPRVQRKDSIDRVFSHLTPQNKRISGRTSTLGLYRTTTFPSFTKVSRESKLNQSCKLKVLNASSSSLFFTCTKVSLCYTSSAHPSQSSGTHWMTRKRTCIAPPCWTWPRSWLCLWLNIWACKHQTPASTVWTRGLVVWHSGARPILPKTEWALSLIFIRKQKDKSLNFSINNLTLS